MVDVFYPLIPARGDNAELRYSLRSLENIKHDNVIIVGHKPSWVQGVIHIPFTDATRKRGYMGWHNVVRKELIACQASGAEDIIMMNDDFYVTRPTEIGFYIREESLDRVLKMAKDRRRPVWVLEAIKNIMRLFPKGVSAYAHVPHRVNRQKYIDLHGKYNLLERQYLTSDVYANEYRSCHNWEYQKDIKIYSGTHKIRTIGNTLFFSTSDALVKGKDFEREMDKLFPNKSRYEV